MGFRVNWARGLRQVRAMFSLPRANASGPCCQDGSADARSASGGEEKAGGMEASLNSPAPSPPPPSDFGATSLTPLHSPGPSPLIPLPSDGRGRWTLGLPAAAIGRIAALFLFLVSLKMILLWELRRHLQA